MNTDTFIEIGNQHKVCEDYIIQGDDPVPFIILSDGCSSSKNTEMGARLLCYLAKQYLKYRSIDELNYLDYDKMGRWIIHNAEMSARQLGLSISCLDATLIIAYHINDMVKIYIYGDGCVVAQAGDYIEITSVDFERNAPFYLSYFIDDYRFELYKKLKLTKTLVGDSNEEEGSTFRNRLPYDSKVVLFYDTTVFKTIMICSDGLQSFLQKTSTHVPASNIVPEMLEFKNIKGEFLKRRLNKYMKQLSKSGIGHTDDLSVGAFINIEV